METRANYALIGLFTLGVIASAFLFVFWFSGGEKQAGRKTYRIIFTGSVSGLSRGANVLFNGLRVGEVKSLGLMDEDPSRVAAVVEVVANTPVNIDTHAKLEFTGLTGIASIALAGGGADTEALVPGPDGAAPVIYGDKSDLQNLLANLQNLSAKSDAILSKADTLLGESDGSIRRTIANVETFSKALSDNAPGINTFLQTATTLGQSLQPLGPKLDSLAGNLDGIVKAVDPARVSSIVTRLDDFVGASAPVLADTFRNVEAVSKTVADKGPEIGELIGGAAEFTRELKPTAEKVQALAGDLDGLVKAVDPTKIASIVSGIEGVVGNGAPAIADTLKNASTFSKALADGSGDVQQTLAAVASLATQAEPLGGKLNELADQAGLVAAAADPAKIAAIVSDGAAFARQLSANGEKIGPILDQAGKVAAAVDPGKVGAIVDDAADLTRQLNAVGGKLGPIADSAGAILAAVEPAQVKALIGDSAGVARQLNSSAGKLDGVAAQASAILAAVDTGKIHAIVSDAAELAAKLNGSAGKLDGLIASAQVLLGSPEARGTLGDIGEAARSIRKLSDNLDIRTKDIAAGITRFTSQGLRQYETLAVDGRRTLDGLNRVVRSLEKNPSQVIFGGKSAVPEYSGN